MDCNRVLFHFELIPVMKGSQEGTVSYLYYEIKEHVRWMHSLDAM